MLFGVNARTAFSLPFPPILSEFGWARGVTAGAFSFGFLVSAVLKSGARPTVDRHGPCLVMELGVCTTAAGVMPATGATAPWRAPWPLPGTGSPGAQVGPDGCSLVSDPRSAAAAIERAAARREQA
jgi:hypothetical protein